MPGRKLDLLGYVLDQLALRSRASTEEPDIAEIYCRRSRSHGHIVVTRLARMR